jgi:hypothetical protein
VRSPSTIAVRNALRPSVRPWQLTGVFVDRLPPGAKCVQNDADEVALAAFLEAVRVAHRMDRREVFASATREFDTKRLGQQIVTALESARIA